MKTFTIKKQSLLNDPDYKLLIDLLNSKLVPVEFLNFCTQKKIDLENLNQVDISGEYDLQKYLVIYFWYPINNIQINSVFENNYVRIVIKNDIKSNNNLSILIENKLTKFNYNG